MSAPRSGNGVSSNNYTYVNEDEIDSELKCIICQQPLVKPLVGTRCGHTFCSVCISNWLKQNSSCPSCRSKTSFETVTTRIILSQLDRLRVRCLRCNESNIERGNFDDHIQRRCFQVRVKCDAAHLNCSWTGTPQEKSQHSALCPLVQATPIVNQLRAEIVALGYQLQVFMNEVRNELDYLQHERSSSKEHRPATANPVLQTNPSNDTKTQYDQIVNDVKYRWRFKSPWSLDPCQTTCAFCADTRELFFKCLICSCDVARANVAAHDKSGRKSTVICRSCVKKYRKI